MNTENTIIFTIARMNPPTQGHILLIETMIETAIKNNVNQINIILSSTVDSEKNPIECEEKRKILYNNALNVAKQNSIKKTPENSSQINNMKIEIICLNDQETNSITNYYSKSPIISKIKYILYKLYGFPRQNLRMILVIGKDRENDFDFLKKLLQELEIPVDFDISVVDRPGDAISATKIRNLALTRDPNDENSFIQHMNTIGLNNDESKDLLYQIRENIENRDENYSNKKMRRKGGMISIRKKVNNYKNKTNKSKKNKTKRKKLLGSKKYNNKR